MSSRYFSATFFNAFNGHISNQLIVVRLKNAGYSCNRLDREGIKRLIEIILCTLFFTLFKKIPKEHHSFGCQSVLTNEISNCNFFIIGKHIKYICRYQNTINISPKPFIRHLPVSQKPNNYFIHNICF